MKIQHLLPAAFAALFVVSCQKEIDWGLGGGSASTRLVSIQSKSGPADSTRVDYSYDASGRLIREKTTGVAAGNSADNDLLIYRNTAGIITRTVQKSAALIQVGVDSLVTRYNYNSGTSRYTSSIFSTTVMGFTIMDSAVYTYDANGRISKDEHYLQTTGLPIPLPPILALRNNYTYSANGAELKGISQEAPSTPGGPLAPVSAQAFTYDMKVNPLVILQEAILLNRPGLFSAGNMTNTIVTNTISPANSFTLDNTYIYNSQNKPDSSYSTRNPGATITASKYFYQ
ncbi:MAG: hypothetical protein ACO25B_03570 [Chitinophagaceae bacterium]